MASIFDSLGAIASGASTGAAVGGPWGALVGGVAGGVLDQYARAKAEGREQEALDILRRNKAELSKIQIPEVQEMLYQAAPEEFVGPIKAANIGQMERMGPSAMDLIQTDPIYAEAMQNTLGSYQDIIEGGGMTDMERLNYERALQQAERQSSAEQAGIAQAMARRGLGGSGQELAQRLAASQESIDRAAAAGREQQAIAQQRALQAIAARGGAASQFRGQEFDEQARKAAAADIIAQFNANMANQALLRQAELNQRAAEQSASMEQGVRARNAANQTEASRFNAEVPMQRFNAQMNKNIASRAAAKPIYDYQMGRAGEVRNLPGQILSGAGALAATPGVKEGVQGLFASTPQQPKGFAPTTQNAQLAQGPTLANAKREDEDELFNPYTTWRP